MRYASIKRLGAEHSERANGHQAANRLGRGGWQWTTHQPTEQVYEVHLSGSEGTIVRTTTISTHTKARKRNPNYGEYILRGQTLIGVGFNDPQVHLWGFPEGGFPTKSLEAPNAYPAYGVAVSIAPSH